MSGTENKSQTNDTSGEVVELYQGAKRIHPKKATGRFANLRIAVLIITQAVFYLLPWVSYNGRQAVWFDALGRHFYIFGLALEPADLLYLTGLLIISAFGLFWWTTIAGRLWCGYACPQTVYTEIMLWIDHFVEGDRNQRLKLEKEPWNARKIRIKTIKYILIFIVAAWTGITFVGWFVPIRQVVPAIFSGTASFGVLGVAFVYGFMTWLMAHIMRGQVCLHMCPYARFQSAMFDHNTLIISYDAERGEPRGKKKKGDDAPKGACVDCSLCVQVCPVGIDIRDGLQYQCIGCAACIDACDEVMEKLKQPRGLVRYTTEAVLNHEYTDADIKRQLLRPKVTGYGTVLFIAIIAWIVGISTRDTMRVDIIKDRGVMVRENRLGQFENSYNLHINNSSELPQTITASVSGLETITLSGLPKEGVVVQAGEVLNIPVQVAAEPDYATKGSHDIQFTFTYQQQGSTETRQFTKKTIFIGGE